MWGRNQKGLLPRGTAVERGSTAEGREGARAKRARKPPCVPCGPPDRAPSALTGHSPTPLTATWGRNQQGLLPRGTAVERGRSAEGREGARAKRARSTTMSPLRPDGRAPGFLPRGTAVERGSTAEGREGARAKRARSIDGFGTAPYPAAGSGDPFPLSLRSRGTKLSGGEIKKDFSPVERQWNGGVRRRPGGGASEASQVDRRVRHCPLPRCRQRGPLPPVAALQGDKATWGRNPDRGADR